MPINGPKKRKRDTHRITFKLFCIIDVCKTIYYALFYFARNSEFGIGPLAQLVERQTLNLQVIGSIPMRPTSLRQGFGWQASPKGFEL